MTTKNTRLQGWAYREKELLKYLRRNQAKYDQNQAGLPWWDLGDVIKFVLGFDERDAKKAGGLKPKKKAKK